MSFPSNNKYSNNNRNRKPRPPIYDENSGVPPTEDEMNAMVKQTKNVLNYWMEVSNRSRKELFEKVKKKSIPDDVINTVLDEYEKLGYVDDLRFAEQFVYSKTTYDKLGKRAISFKLTQKGVDKEIIDTVLMEVDDETEEEQAKELAYKKAKANRRYDNQKRLHQIVGLLSRKGYSGSYIFRLAQEAIKEVDEENRMNEENDN